MASDKEEPARLPMRINAKWLQLESGVFKPCSVRLLFDRKTGSALMMTSSNSDSGLAKSVLIQLICRKEAVTRYLQNEALLRELFLDSVKEVESFNAFLRSQVPEISVHLGNARMRATG